MRTEVVLTVAESKRLIAKGVAALDYVGARLQSGVIVLCKGSTNAYIYEELTHSTFDKRGYITGRTMPAKNPPVWKAGSTPELVLVNGKPAPDLDRFSALEHMHEGDIYIKGANALNYSAGVAGISIGHPAGGTIGGSLGAIIGRKLRLLIPVGLEKEVPYDIVEMSALIAEPDERIGAVNSLWPVHGTIFSEIEAFETLSGVDAYPIAAGGVGGAEGGIRFLLAGSADAVRDALKLVESIQGEPAL